MEAPSSRYRQRWEISGNNFVWPRQTYLPDEFLPADCYSQKTETITSCIIEYVSRTEFRFINCTETRNSEVCFDSDIITVVGIDDTTYFIKFTSIDSFDLTDADGNCERCTTFNRE